MVSRVSASKLMFAAIAVSAVTHAIPCVAIGGTEADSLGQQIKKDLHAARDGSLFASWHLRWRDEDHDIATPTEISRLRAEVRNRPDHPARQELARYERRMRDGPDVGIMEVWFIGPSHWRKNHTSARSEQDYFDMVVDGEIGWGLSPEQLTLINPKGTIPAGYDYPSSEGGILEALGWFGHGALILPAVMGLEIVGPVRRAGLWVMEARLDRRVSMELTADASASPDGRLFFSRATIKRMDKRPQEQGRRWEVMRNNGTFPEPVLAMEMSEFAPDGRLVRRLVLERAEKFDADRMRAVLTPPTLGGSDSVRGIVSFKEQHDHRGGTPVFTFNRDGQQSVLHGNELPEARAARRLKEAGWWAGGAAAVALAALVWYKVRSA